MQKRVLNILSHKMDDFYLVGGTALSLYYFHHRESVDLDFFTQEFNRVRIMQLVKLMEEGLKKKINLIAEQAQKDKIQIMVFSVPIDKNSYLKIDFVQDYLKLVKIAKTINGIKIFSLEDIYLRKIYAATGTKIENDSIGRRIAIGGRQEAKDFYDLYCLSSIFMGLSKFSFKYGNELTQEALIRWFRTYDRMDIKTGLLELKVKKDLDYRIMEHHFKKEIDKILEKEIGAI